METRRDKIEHGLELARTGNYPDVQHVITALEREGFADARETFRNPVTRILLRGALKMGWSRNNNNPSVA